MFKKNVLRIVIAALFDIAIISIAAVCVKTVLEKKMRNISTCNCALEETVNE